jgi:hypothetical protein
MSRSRSQSRNISRYEPHEKIMQDLMKENERLKGLLKINDEKEVKTSMNGLNKMVDIEELKKELDELRKRDELRTRMLTEDLRAFEEKRQELILDRHQKIGTARSFSYSQETKLRIIDIVKSHLKFLLLGLPIEEFCIINDADNMSQGVIDQQYLWGGKIVNPFKVQFPPENFLRELTKEEYIEARKKGIVRGADPEGCAERTKDISFILNLISD